jgi:hypothetical protein
MPVDTGSDLVVGTPATRAVGVAEDERPLDDLVGAPPSAR